MVFRPHWRFEPKFPSFGRKLVSTLPELKHPSFIPQRIANPLEKFNPLFILKDPRKSRNLSLNDTKIIHGHLLRINVLYFDVFDANTLLNCYFRCGNVEYAFKLFEKIPEPNIVSWNSLLSGCNKNLLFQDSWRFFCRMRWLDLVIDEYTYGSVLSACGALECILQGEQVYGLSLKKGFFSNAYVRTGMIDLFSVSGRFEDALRVFYDVMPCDNVASWSAIISAAVKNMEYWVAINIFKSMSSQGMMPSEFTISSVLSACGAVKYLEFGKGVQGWMIKCGLKEDVLLGTSLLDFYAKSGDMNGAVRQFWCMPVRNVVSWTAMLSGFAQIGDHLSAFDFFNKMRKTEEVINSYTVTSLLLACANPDAVEQAAQVHCWILKTGFYSDPVVKASLINMYSKIGAFGSSEIVFSESEDVKHLSTFASMIAAFAQTKYSERAIYLFQKMLQTDIKPEMFCTSSVLGIIDSLTLGRQIHGYTVKTGLVLNVSVGSSLSAMYSKCGSLEESLEVFNLLEGKDSISWASMVASFVKNGCPNEAIYCFREMLSQEIKPDEITLNALLSACSALCLVRTGKEVHGFSLRNGLGGQIFVYGALVNMYSKCGTLGYAKGVYEMMPTKDHITRSTLVSGYAHCGNIEEALNLFHDMLTDDVEIDNFTMSSILRSVGELSIGCKLHARVVKMGLESKVAVGSSLLIMYSKIGNIDDCCKAFEHIEAPDAISWTALIASYAQHGKSKEALQIYEVMRRSRYNPDSVTFVAVLSACSHGGMVEEGYFHFNSMKKDYGIEPGYRHYACMVDLLGRAGRLKEAERFIFDMPIKPDALVWGTLLAACKMHGDVHLGKLAAGEVMALEPKEAGTYVSLANIFADMGLWEEVLELRSEMMGPGVKKEAGWSSL